MKQERWREVSRLYHDAAALTPAERAAFLENACGGDATLRAVLESLLVGNSNLEGLLEAKDGHVSLIGRRIGVYEITALLGAGGMGEVYRARDTKLGRDVAIKVLPAAFASDADRLARFEREARVLASLNHPHIGAIHGVEDASGVPALVLELVEGETLADRIARGPIPIREALGVARQIADALDAAHEHGIIHRDLKPANVKVTPDGTVKVLDFGLARASTDGAPSPDATESGMILGTAAYMSPEQTRGQRVDKRADIWAFGCVLYEMLTGRPAFPGATVSDTIASILDREPDWTALPEGTSPFLRRPLEHCLEKDPRQRLRDIADARHLLAEPISSPAGDAVKLRTRQRRVPMIGVAVLAGIVAGALIWQAVQRPQPASAVVTTFRLVLPAVVRGAAEGSLPGIGLSTAVSRRVAISRDGRFVVYNGEQGGISRLYLHRLDQLDPIPIRGAEGEVAEIGSIFLHPDGEWVGYHDTRTHSIKKIRITGGSPSTIYDARAPGFNVPAVWGSDGTIIFSSRKTGGLMRVSDAGGPVTVLTSPQGEIHYQPQFIPSGDVVMFTIDRNGQRPTIAALQLNTGKYKALVEGSAPRATASGHLLFMRDGGIWAAKFDSRALALTSTPSLVVGDLEWFANFDVADNGTLVYTPTQSGRMLVWVDRQGREEPLRVPPQTYMNPRMSPDGNRVILDVRDFRDAGDIWILDLHRGNLDKLTSIDGNKRHAIWTRDGTRILFSLVESTLADGPRPAGRFSKASVYAQRSDGTGTPERILESDLLQYPISFTADGARVVLREMGLGHGGWNLRIMSLRDRKMEPLLVGDSYETNGEISPDGKWLAYESEESFRREIYVRPFPDVHAARWSISTSGGREPLWSRSGRELLYLGLDGRLMKVDVQTAPTFAASPPVRLLNNVYLFHSLSATPGRTYDISPDGTRFLMIKEPPATVGAQLVVTLNWAATLDK